MNERTPLWVEYVRTSSFKPLTRWLASDPKRLAAFLPQNTSRSNPKMDYSVGGPLWLEWQRLQSHSEWERWKDLYGKDETLAVHPFRWGLLYDWLLENDLPLEAEEVKRCRLEEPISSGRRFQLSPPNWIPASLNEGSDPEPVEGAA